MKIKEKFLTIIIIAISLMAVCCYRTSSSSFLKENTSEATIPQTIAAKTDKTSGSSQQLRTESKLNKKVVPGSSNFQESSRVEQTNPICKGNTLSSPNSPGLSKLSQGKALCNGNWQLVMENDGRVVLKNQSGAVIWSSEMTSSSSSKTYLEVTEKGFLRTCEELATPVPYWNQSHILNDDKYVLKLTEAGNLVISSADPSQVWSLFNRSSLTSSLDDKSNKARLYSKQGLITGKYIFFNDPTGFLRFYENGTEKWNIPTNGRDVVAIIQDDGNFVTYTNEGPTWSGVAEKSNTSAPYTLLIDEIKGQVVIKDAANIEIFRK